MSECPCGRFGEGNVAHLIKYEVPELRRQQIFFGGGIPTIHFENQCDSAS